MMASAGAKAVRRAEAISRLSRHLGHKPVDLHANAKGDPEMALIMTLERVADKVEERHAETSGKSQTRIAELEAEIAELTAKLQQSEATGTGDSAEQQLEAETGHDVVKTGDVPPTYVETDKPAPANKAAKEAKSAK